MKKVRKTTATIELQPSSSHLMFETFWDPAVLSLSADSSAFA